jgi:hypothetical protein
MPVAATIVAGKKFGELIDGRLQLQRKAHTEQRRGDAKAARFRYEVCGNDGRVHDVLLFGWKRSGRKTSAPPSPFPMAFLRTNAALRVKRIRGTAGAIGKGSRRDGTDGDAARR